MKNLYRNKLDQELYRTNWDIYPQIISLFHIKRSDRILDAGCGNGELKKYLPGFDLYGFDSSAAAVKIAKKEGYKRVVVSGISHTPFRDKEFTKTLCVQVFQYLEDPSGSFSELLRITDGEILVSIPNFRWLKIKSFLSSKNRKVYRNALSYVNQTDSKFLDRLARANNLKLTKFYISNKWGPLRNLFGDLLSSEIVGIFRTQ